MPCVCQLEVLGAAHRGSRRIAPVATRHARGRPARRQPPSAGAPAADHAAALWQLCCRIGRTTTVAFQMVGSHARGHNLPRATGARRGVNNGAAKRAGDGDRAYPANRHRVCIRTRSCVRRLPLFLSIGAAFGGDPETGKLTGVLPGRGRVPCAVGRHAARASGTPRQNTGRAQHHDGSTKKCPFSNGSLGPHLRWHSQLLTGHGVARRSSCRALAGSPMTFRPRRRRSAACSTGTRRRHAARQAHHV